MQDKCPTCYSMTLAQFSARKRLTSKRLKGPLHMVVFFFFLDIMEDVFNKEQNAEQVANGLYGLHFKGERLQ